MGAIAVGGMAGALARWGLIELVDGRGGDWPWAVFVANLVGCFVLGMLVARYGPRRHVAPLPAGAATGFCGALTTFSSFAVDLALFLRDDRFVLAALYLTISLALGFAVHLTGRAIVDEAAP